MSRVRSRKVEVVTMSKEEVSLRFVGQHCLLRLPRKNFDFRRAMGSLDILNPPKKKRLILRKKPRA